MLVRDDPSDPGSELIERPTLTRQSSLTINLRAAGGFMGRLAPRAAFTIELNAPTVNAKKRRRVEDSKHSKNASENTTGWRYCASCRRRRTSVDNLRIFVSSDLRRYRGYV